MAIGIDKIGFATGSLVLDLKDLAKARKVDPDKYVVGLMQHKTSICDKTEDIVTLGARAADSILDASDKETIEMVIVGTESGIDQSKASSTYIHQLLDIQPFARAIEIKEACYGGAAALNLARDYIASHPQSKVLVIASDIARYGAHSAGEPTQGAGAVAIVVSENPHILALDDASVAMTRDSYDFWRPNYAKYPEVNGRFSTIQYIDCLTTIYTRYCQKTGKSLTDFSAMVLHIPFVKQGLKALQKLLKDLPKEAERLTANFMDSISYNQNIGNLYTGSLFLSFLSLIETSTSLSAGDNILFYSYGSGAVCELFSGTLVAGFEKRLNPNRQVDLDNRRQISVTEYESIFFYDIPIDDTGTSPHLTNNPKAYDFLGIDHHKRLYYKPSSR